MLRKKIYNLSKRKKKKKKKNSRISSKKAAGFPVALTLWLSKIYSDGRRMDGCWLVSKGSYMKLCAQLIEDGK